MISINWVLGKVEKIDENTKSIRRLESKLDVMEKVSNLSDRMSKIEGWKEVFDRIKQKRAQLNPQLILVILIIILIILYLRSQGNT